jgi:hypothetical protein
VRCMICSDAERRGVEGNFSILVPRFADHRTDLQHWHAASAFDLEGPLIRTSIYNSMLWAMFWWQWAQDLPWGGYFVAVYDLAIEGGFCCSHALRAQF